jgi:predicted CXXCH cytochrome family protein
VRSFGYLVFGMLLALCFSAQTLGDTGRFPVLAPTADGYAKEGACASCHQAQARAWKNSDHDWAMREASEPNVLGNFKNVQFFDGKVKARFFRRDGSFYVNTEGADGKPADFLISYTFGYKPLQQYLVSLPGGRLQSLTIAWDSRAKKEGGQRWFSLYPGQHFTPNDALHWTGRYQNWNAMCADCHSSNLQKNYDDKTDSFSSTWHEQNVGCQSCHGPAQTHVDWASQLRLSNVKKGDYASIKDIGLKVDFAALGNQGLVDQCARCHSRRQALGVGPQSGLPLLDHSLPSVLRPDLYHADGQLLGEDYEFGSFSQSKMYAAGVACTNCHDPHTTKVKIQGNGLCEQCHTPTPPKQFPSLQARNYDTPEHHHHQPGSPGAQCVNCHMPEHTYMQVDQRRDHSIRIPRPDLDAKTGSPDACTMCHKDREPSWATKAIEDWFGTPHRPEHYGQALQAARLGNPDSLAQLTGLIQDLGSPAIVRASAADQLANLGEPALPTLRLALKDDSALVRAYAIAGFAQLPPVERVTALLPQLDDANLAVRDEAVRALVSVPILAIPADRQAGFRVAKADYEKRLRGNADLPGNRLNLAVFLERDGRQLEALEQYRMALKLDAYFAPARVNLVTLANELMRPEDAERALREGVALSDSPVADRGNLAYMLALLLVERGQSQEAAHWLDEASTALPNAPRIFYNQGLLLLQLNQRESARAALETGLAQSPNDADLLYAMVYLYGTGGDRGKAKEYVKRLHEAAPDDPRLTQLQQLMGGPQ